MDWLVRNLATLGFIGKKLPAPGTFGSLLGTIFFLIILCSSSFSNLEISILFSFLFVLGIPLTSRAELILKKVDPSEVIWDEFTAIPFVYIFCLDKLKTFPNMDSIVLLSLGFLLFRILFAITTRPIFDDWPKSTMSSLSLFKIPLNSTFRRLELWP